MDWETIRKFMSKRTLEICIIGHEQYKGLLSVLEPVNEIANLAWEERLYPSNVKDGIELGNTRTNMVSWGSEGLI